MKRFLMLASLILVGIIAFAQTQKKDIALVYPSNNARFSSRARGAIMKAVKRNKDITLTDLEVKDVSSAILKKYDAIVLMLDTEDLKEENVVELINMNKDTAMGSDSMIVWEVDRKISTKARVDLDADVISSATVKKVALPVITKHIIPFILE